RRAGAGVHWGWLVIEGRPVLAQCPPRLSVLMVAGHSTLGRPPSRWRGALDLDFRILVHGASWRPEPGLWCARLALDNPDRIASLVLLNSYYHWTAGLRRPRAIALYSTPTVRTAARAIVRLDGVG